MIQCDVLEIRMIGRTIIFNEINEVIMTKIKDKVKNIIYSIRIREKS